MSIPRLSPGVIKQLGYYVYLYVHPLNNPIFYVGKAKGNRTFYHLRDASETRKTQPHVSTLTAGSGRWGSHGHVHPANPWGGMRRSVSGSVAVDDTFVGR